MVHGICLKSWFVLCCLVLKSEVRMQNDDTLWIRIRGIDGLECSIKMVEMRAER